tara:strand:+ start:85111 stop:86439 length:1329 start_codon:yes stop_codon:yes gene_type:complete
MKSVNPHNLEVINTFQEMNQDEIKGIIQKSHHRFEQWKKSTHTERSKLLNQLADQLEKEKEKLSELMHNEMGKLKSEGVGEIEKCAWVCRYYAENAKTFLADKTIKTDASKSFIRYSPKGVHLAIMPWNFPFWQVFRFLTPCIASGNTALLKHASNVSGCALAIEELFKSINAPADIFRTLLVSGKNMESVLESELIQGVSLTGSTPAGLKVIQQTSKKLISTVLELGGSDPYIVFEDADLDDAVENIVQGRFLNCGQSCIAAKRLLVQETIYDSFIEKLTSQTKQKELGPMASKDFRDDIHQQVIQSIQEGAKLVIGGEITNEESAYYPATILKDVTPEHTAFKEEMFGPVAVVSKFKNSDEAIILANLSEFGLGSAIFTKNEECIEYFINELQAGSVFVNHFVKSDPRLPFGGEKLSGIGRELSEEGIREFVNIKTVSIK